MIRNALYVWFGLTALATALLVFLWLAEPAAQVPVTGTVSGPS